MVQQRINSSYQLVAGQQLTTHVSPFLVFADVPIPERCLPALWRQCGAHEPQIVRGSAANFKIYVYGEQFICTSYVYAHI